LHSVYSNGNVTKERVEQEIAKMDANGDRKISYEEFNPESVDLLLANSEEEGKKNGTKMHHGMRMRKKNTTLQLRTNSTDDAAA
jgi:hypothetical protein